MLFQRSLQFGQLLVSFETAKALACFEHAGCGPAQRHLRMHLFSNNPSRRRIEAVANSFELPYTAGAGKPRRGPLRQVLEQLQLPAQQVALFGDRVFTDVLAGNRLGLFTVLVQPIGVSGQASRNDRLQRGERTLARWCGARVDSGLPQ